HDVLQRFIELQSYKNQFLPIALRNFFAKLDAPEDQTIYVLCIALILLSIDLTSPYVKNKMSKREFIRNTRRAIINKTLSDELAGHLYDNIYLIGHVARSITTAR
ncbi:unnamed protein product, partial [Rotaria sp. Silwood2]